MVVLVMTVPMVTIPMAMTLAMTIPNHTMMMMKENLLTVSLAKMMLE